MVIETDERGVYQTNLVVLSNTLWQPDIKGMPKDSVDALSFTNRFQTDSFTSKYSYINAFIEVKLRSLDKQQHEKLLGAVESSLAKNEVLKISNANLEVDSAETSYPDFKEVFWLSPEVDWNADKIAKHSASAIDASKSNALAFRVFFAGIEPKDQAVYHVLSKIISQRNSTYSQNLVQSGLALNSSFSHHPARSNEFLYFDVAPNPFGLKEAIEAFFEELYAMPLFDYTTKAQLDLAKEQIAIDLEFDNDRFTTRAERAAGFAANGVENNSKAYLDSVNVITKVDIMNFIRKYLHHQPFLLQVDIPDKMADEVGQYLYTTNAIDEYTVSFDGKKDTKIEEGDLSELQQVAYILNLTSWAKVDIELYGSARKKHKQKRAKEIQAYLDSKGVRNKFNLVFRGSFSKEQTDVIKFKIAENEG